MSTTAEGAKVTLLDWVAGALVAAVMLGPALTPGTLLNLDLSVTPEIPVPNGIYGLGPGLSQRVPLFLIFGSLSPLFGGPLVTKLFLLIGLTAGFVGMGRFAAGWAGSLSRPARWAAGAFWVGGPFMATRISVGHLGFVWLVAVLPWVINALLHPLRRPRRTFLAMTALAFGGPAMGTLALVAAVVGLLASLKTLNSEGAAVMRLGRFLLVVLAPSLLWVGPTVVLLWAGAQVGGAAWFPTQASGAVGWAAVLVGNGFWIPSLQIGGTGLMAALVGLVLTALAVLGTRGSQRGWALPAVGIVGLLLTLASAVPGLRYIYQSLSGLSVGAPLRESQRFLVLWLLWLAPGAAAGIDRLGNRIGWPAVSGEPAWTGRPVPIPAVGLLAAVVAVSAGGWWAMNGTLEPVQMPTGWAAARAVVREQPGTTVVLPWSEYPPLTFLDGRTAFNPVPDYLGGDTISNFDPSFDLERPQQEQVDRRAWFLADVLRGQGKLGPAFNRVGARWVVLVHEKGSAAAQQRLDLEPGAFRMVLNNPDVSVYRVQGWTDNHFERPIPPLVFTSSPPGSTLNMAAAPGWVRGWFQPASSTPEGLLRLPSAGGGVLWFWPALLLMAVDLAILVAVGVTAAKECNRDCLQSWPRRW